MARHKGQARAEQYVVDAGPLRWLVDLLDDAGGVVVTQTDRGTVYRPIGWPEIVAWVEGAQMHEVGPFWRRQLIRLSAVLAGAMNTSPVAETPAPYEPPEEF